MASSMKDKGKKPSTEIAKPKPSELGEEMGILASFPVTSYDSFAYGQSFSNNSGAFLASRDRHSVPVEDLVRMRRRDYQTRALLRMFILPILSCVEDAEWVAGEYGAGKGEKEAQFANDMFRTPPHAGGMTSTLHLIIRQMLLALVEGFSAFEEVYQIPTKGPLKGKIVLRKLAHRDSTTVQFIVDDKGGFNGIYQKAKGPDGKDIRVHIEKEKVLFFANQREENPFYGVSLFEAAWYSYDVKAKMYYVAHIAAQLAAVPGRIGTHPLSASPAEKAAFRRMLSDFAFNSSAVLPEGFKVEPFTSQTGFNFLELINHHSKAQAKSVLLQFADSDQRLAVIENGGADASADFFVQALESIMAEISEIFSFHLMPKFIDWNFGTGNYPVWRFGKLSDSSRDTIKEVFNLIVTSSVLNCTPEFMREAEEKLAHRLGFDIDYAEIRKREEEAAEKQAELAELEAELLEKQSAEQAAQQAAGGAEEEEKPEEGAEPPAEPEEPQSPQIATAQLSDAYPTLQEDLDSLVAMAQQMMSANPMLPDGVADPEFDG